MSAPSEEHSQKNQPALSGRPPRRPQITSDLQSSCCSLFGSLALSNAAWPTIREAQDLPGDPGQFHGSLVGEVTAACFRAL